MIKVIDREMKSGAKILVIGTPYQWMGCIGQCGEYTVKRGRYAGQVKTGERWGHPSYSHSLKLLLERLQTILSEQFGISVENQQIEGIEGWKKAAEELENIHKMTEQISKEFQFFVEKYGKQMQIIDTKLLKEELSNGGKVEISDEDADDDSEEDLNSEE